MVERFINAAKDGYVDILREANRKDLNTPDEDGMTATLWAAHSGKLEALRLIVGREGDVNKADYLGMTSLHHAAMKGHMNVVSYLVHWGCNVYALDNDLHSALDLAALYDRTEIVKFLDNDLAQRQAKNPRQASRLREEAMKTAENNIKKYEKLQDAAAKRAEKEQRKLQKERGHHQEDQQHFDTTDGKEKKSFLKTLTLRIRPGGHNSNKSHSRGSSSQYSEVAGFSHTVSGGNRTGIGKKIQKRRTEHMTLSAKGSSEFKVSQVDNDGNRTVRSLGPAQGIRGTTSEVLYVTAADSGSDQNHLGGKQRPGLFGDVFQGNNIYKAQSEPDLLDSGVDSYYGDYDEDEPPGLFYRPGMGKTSFLQKNRFLNTIQSFDDGDMPRLSNGVNGDINRLSGDGDDIMHHMDDGSDVTLTQQNVPWNLDELGNLDDDEDDGDNNEFSAVNMFLWTCGLASYLHIFTQEKIDLPLLMDMTDSDMKELGLPFGPRKKLREAIVRRKSVLEKPVKMSDTHL